jgi:hypothetical protein
MHVYSMTIQTSSIQWSTVTVTQYVLRGEERIPVVRNIAQRRTSYVCTGTRRFKQSYSLFHILPLECLDYSNWERIRPKWTLRVCDLLLILTEQ